MKKLNCFPFFYLKSYEYPTKNINLHEMYVCLVGFGFVWVLEFLDFLQMVKQLREKQKKYHLPGDRLLWSSFWGENSVIVDSRYPRGN